MRIMNHPAFAGISLAATMIHDRLSYKPGLAFIAALLCFVSAAAQDTTIPKRGLYPTGSYASSGTDTINTTNGDLMLRFPLASLPAGRGGNPGFGVDLYYNSKLFDSTVTRYAAGNNNGYYDLNKLQVSENGGWHIGLRYKIITVQRSTSFDGGSVPSCTQNQVAYLYNYKLKVRFPDGSVHEFRPTGYSDLPGLSDGYYNINWNGFQNSCTNGGPGSTVVSTGMTYYSTDGTHIRLFIGPPGSGNPWTLYMPDGSTVTDTGLNGASTVQTITDRNGNYVTVQATSANGHTGTIITDQLGRTITDEQDPAGYDYVYTAGVNGEKVQWTIKWKANWIYQQYTDSTDDGTPSTLLTRPIRQDLGGVDQLILPQQAASLTYTFGYDGSATSQTSSYTAGWGYLNSITLPSGAVASYTYQNDGMSNLLWSDVLGDYPIQKNLTYNLEYDGSTTPTTETWTYLTSSGQSSITAPDGGTTLDYYQDTSDTTDLFFGGTVYKHVNGDGSFVERIWQANTPGGAYNPGTLGCNPFVKTEFTTVLDASGSPSQTAIKDYSYDKNGNVTGVTEYDWVPYSSVPRTNGSNGTIPSPTGIPSSATVKSVTTHVYSNVTPDAADTSTDSPSAYYNSSAPQLLTAVANTTVSDGEQPLEYTEYTYDNPLTTGNLTLQRSWDSTRGAVSAPLTTANSVSLVHSYDQFGNVISSTDANGTRTQITYDSNNLFPITTVQASGTSVARTTQRTFDFNAGVMTSATDADNNVTTQVTYDALGRPTLVQEAAGKPEETDTATTFDDINRCIIVKSDLNAINDGKLVKIQRFDPLGRVRLTQQLEDATTQSPTDETAGIKVQTRYNYTNQDAELVSNPYRASSSVNAASESTMGWTMTTRDHGGRVTQVQMFAGSTMPSPWGSGTTTSTGTVGTSYDGVYTTVTDQAGNVRRSMVDGLGRLARMDEPDNTNSLGASSAPVRSTSYLYDGLGNLRKVAQGSQQRFFMYSSLSRLLAASNPESAVNSAISLTDTVTGNSAWNVYYQYDLNGNLTQKTDARNVVTTYQYDALNRVTSRAYSDGTAQVGYTYDDPHVPKSRGRLTQMSSSVSATSYGGYDALGRVLSSTQTTDGQAYAFSYGYNHAGEMISQTYPSGRVVTTGYDAAGRVSSVAGQMNQTSTTYAGSIGYTAHSEMQQVKFGNNLWEHTNYNSRLQPVQIGLDASSSSASGILEIDYGYGTTANNGNLQSQTIKDSSISVVQSYTYDTLNRLLTATEMNGSTQNWQQSFSFDRFGNRSINIGGTTAAYVGPNPQISAATNRITPRSGEHYAYDPAGNLTTDQTGNTFAYDAENRQITYNNGYANGGASYYYDGDGRRIKAATQSGITTFVYNVQGELVAEYRNVSPQGSGGTSYLVGDSLGTPRVVTNASGAVIGRHDYLPFGEELDAGVGGRTTSQGYSQSDGARQGFTGYEKDAETGLDFAQTRYYSSVQGRFTSPDRPFAGQYRRNPQSWNMYQYVLNSPLVFIDPMGLSHKNKHGELVGDYDGEEQDGLVWNKKKKRWVDPVAVQGGTTTDHAAPVRQTTYLEVIIWNPSASFHGLFGHVSYNINGKSWSWEIGGWAKHINFQDYLKQNTYREGTGYVLGDENDPEFAEHLANQIETFNGDGSIPVFGPYGLRQDNCGEAFCRAVNNTPGLPQNGGMLPVEHKAYIVYNMRPYIRAVHHYLKSQPVSNGLVPGAGGKHAIHY